MKIEHNEGYDHTVKTNIPKNSRGKKILRNMPTQWITFFVIFIGVVLIVVMGIWPPWKEIFNGLTLGGRSIHSENPAGYYFILGPPEPENFAISFTIDFSRLLIQWFLVTLIVGFIVWTLKWVEKRITLAVKDRSTLSPEEVLYHMDKVEPHQVRLVDFLVGQGLTLNNLETIIKSIQLAREAGYIPEGQSFIELLKQDIRSAYYGAYFNDEPVYPKSSIVEWPSCANGHKTPYFGCPACIRKREVLEEQGAVQKENTDDLEDTEG